MDRAAKTLPELPPGERSGLLIHPSKEFRMAPKPDPAMALHASIPQDNSYPKENKEETSVPIFTRNRLRIVDLRVGS
jgi:hypothetical protein